MDIIKDILNMPAPDRVGDNDLDPEPARPAAEFASTDWVGGDEALRTDIARIIKEWRAEIANCKTGERAAMATDPMFAARWNGKEIGMERCANDLERAVRRAQEGKPPTE